MPGTTALLPFQTTEMSPAQLAAAPTLPATPDTPTGCTPSSYDADSWWGLMHDQLTGCLLSVQQSRIQ